MATAREQVGKHIITTTAVMSCNIKKAVGSSVAMQSSARWTVTPGHPHQQRNNVFCWVRAEAMSAELKHS
jgi:hypothetical protein